MSPKATTDASTSLEQLKLMIKEFCEARDWDQFHGAKDLAIGLCTESAEVLDHFRFKNDKEVEALLRDEKRRTEISHELADTLFFILRFSQRYGIDLSRALNDKMKLNGEKYPVSKSKGSNLKYNEHKE